MYTFETALKSLFNLRDTLNMCIAPVNEQQTTATDTGFALYNLGELTQSQTYLTIAAIAGNRAAQYALGEVVRRRANELTDEAKKWYRLAADQNHVYALLRLGDEDSRKKARELAQAEADKGNADAMLELYELDQNIETLKKAANAGSLEAQYILAEKYEDDESLIPDSTERDSTVLDLLKKASEGGLPRAMAWYTNHISFRQNLPFQRQWLEKRAQLNDVYALRYYALSLGGLSDEYGFTEDLVKGYGLIWLIAESVRENALHRLSRDDLASLAKVMTPDQIKDAKVFAESWKKNHPPMSEYRLTYHGIK